MTPFYLVRELEVCPGGRHAWYLTSHGDRVRKPIGQALGYLGRTPLADFTRPKLQEVHYNRLPWYVRMWRSFIRFFSKR